MLRHAEKARDTTSGDVIFVELLVGSPTGGRYQRAVLAKSQFSAASIAQPLRQCGGRQLLGKRSGEPQASHRSCVHGRVDQLGDPRPAQFSGCFSKVDTVA